MTTVAPHDRQATPAEPPREQAAPSRPRDPFLDNAKFIFVALVVVGHAWTLAANVSYLYSWLYLWHVPAFVLVTGYLSRSFRFTKRHLHKLAVTVVFPYALFEGLFALLRIYVGGEKLELLWLNPHWPMWYLSVLFLWRLATPVLQRVPHVVPLSVAVSLLGGLVSVKYLDGNRAMGFLPFFVIGLMATDRQRAWLMRPVVRRAGLAVLTAGVAMAWFVESRLDTEWLYYRTPYEDLGVGDPELVAHDAHDRLRVLHVGRRPVLPELPRVLARRERLGVRRQVQAHATPTRSISVPRPRFRASSTAARASARSWIASPVESKTVISVPRRPGFFPATTSPSVPWICSRR